MRSRGDCGLWRHRRAEMEGGRVVAYQQGRQGGLGTGKTPASRGASSHARRQEQPRAQAASRLRAAAGAVARPRLLCPLSRATGGDRTEKKRRRVGGRVSSENSSIYVLVDGWLGHRGFVGWARYMFFFSNFGAPRITTGHNPAPVA